MPREINVAVLTPTTGICRMSYAQSLARLVMYFAQVRVFEDVPVQGLIPYAVEGSGIAQNYENMVRKFMEDEAVHWTHFLSVEDDMMFPPDGLHQLLRHDVPVVGANYSTNKGNPLRFTAGYTTPGDRFLTRPESTGLEECGLLPQGFTLVKREVYEAITPPWYMAPNQDYYFSRQATEAGFKLYVDHDLSKRIRHIGPHLYTYEDALRDELKLMEESSNGG